MNVKIVFIMKIMMVKKVIAILWMPMCPPMILVAIPVNEVFPHENMQILVTVNGPLNKRLIQVAFYLKENPKDSDFLWDGEGFYIFVHHYYKYIKTNVLAWRNMPMVYDK